MRVAVIQSPGSNCDQDALFGLNLYLGVKAEYVWHRSDSLTGFDAVILPGGFTYGDYLRGGAIASRSPIMSEVVRFANEGRLVLGICNGFQILAELGLLPGALLRNQKLKFICRKVYLKAANTSSPWTRDANDILSIPVAHNEGRFVVEDDTLKKLQDDDRIAFYYCDDQGNATEESNPNGATDNIAGVLNEKGNVLGMMPHPERVLSPLLGGDDGKKILSCLVGA